MQLAIIVAAATNGAIGIDNKLPWHLPEDLQYFKRTTMGKPIIMGRKTFDSIGKPLPGRANIVVTRQTDWSHSGVSVAGSLDEALAIASSQVSDTSVNEAMLIGGAELYRHALALTDRIYLTKVHTTVDGDAFFPAIDESQWVQVSSERHESNGEPPLGYEFCLLERRTLPE